MAHPAGNRVWADRRALDGKEKNRAGKHQVTERHNKEGDTEDTWEASSQVKVPRTRGT